MGLDEQTLKVLDPRVSESPLEVVKLFLLAKEVKLLGFKFLLRLRIQGA